MATLLAVATSIPASAQVSSTSGGAFRNMPEDRGAQPSFLAKKAVSNSSSLPKRAKGETYTLIDEDFSGFTAGTEDEPDSIMLAGEQVGSLYLPDGYTKESGWRGNCVYQAGGALALVLPSGSYFGDYIYTPMGDYSGELNIHFRIKAIGTSKVTMTVSAITGFDGDYFISADADSHSLTISPEDGWTEVDLTMNNYSSDPEGRIRFYPYGSVLMDDIKITSTETFIAAPAVNGVTDFTTDGFTISWNPVDRAEKYHYQLLVHDSSNDTVYEEDFEDVDDDLSNLPEGWTVVQNHEKKISETEGADGSRGLMLYNDEYLASPINSTLYETGSAWLYYVNPDDPEDISGYFEVDIYVPEYGGWVESGLEFYASELTGEWDIYEILDEYFYCADYIYGYRLRPSGIPDNAYVVVDNVSMMSTGALVEQTEQGGYTTGLTHTFTGLDPWSDYYYRVNAVDGDLESSTATDNHVLGLTTPEALPATDITEDSYTANWEETPKATSYTIYSFGVNTAKEDTEDYTLLSEDFSKIDESVTTATSIEDYGILDEYNVISLDAYTSNPGWESYGTAVAEGMVGVYYYLYDYLYVQTPLIYVGNDSTYKVHIKAYCRTSDIISVVQSDGNYTYVYAEQDDNLSNGYGVVDTTLELTAPGTTDRLRLLTAYGMEMLLDELTVTQNVKEGDIIPTYIATYTTDSSTLSQAIDGLKDLGYPQYGYTVKATWEIGDSSVESTSEVELVTLDTSGIEDVASSSQGATVQERYNISGQRISNAQRGLNIMRMSDGTTRKVVVK